MKLSDQEAGYYVGIAYYTKMLQDLIEEFQEHGIDPYKIVDALLFSTAKLRDDVMSKLKDSDYTFEGEDDPN